MSRIRIVRAILFSMLMLLNFKKVDSCSMYKITKDGKTIVGTNFDAYYLTP